MYHPYTKGMGSSSSDDGLRMDERLVFEDATRTVIGMTKNGEFAPLDVKAFNWCLDRYMAINESAPASFQDEKLEQAFELVSTLWNSYFDKKSEPNKPYILSFHGIPESYGIGDLKRLRYAFIRYETWMRMDLLLEQLLVRMMNVA